MMWSNFLAPVTTRAAGYWMTGSFCSSSCAPTCSNLGLRRRHQGVWTDAGATWTSPLAWLAARTCRASQRQLQHPELLLQRRASSATARRTTHELWCRRSSSGWSSACLATRYHVDDARAPKASYNCAVRRIEISKHNTRQPSLEVAPTTLATF